MLRLSWPDILTAPPRISSRGERCGGDDGSIQASKIITDAQASRRESNGTERTHCADQRRSPCRSHDGRAGSLDRTGDRTDLAPHAAAIPEFYFPPRHAPLSG